ncbi:MAG: hypothetical protein OHK0023_13790 [Anaerolineae bacterium]
MAVVGRLKQGLKALFAFTQPVQDDTARQILSPELYALFCTMRRAERQHSLSVLRTIQRMGETNLSLWQAALLHDVGKTRVPFSVLARTMVVLMRKIAPKLAYRWGSVPLEQARFYQRPFVMGYQHPGWSAEMIAAAGADDLTVQLVRAHAERLPNGAPHSEYERLLLALQAADNIN